MINIVYKLSAGEEYHFALVDLVSVRVGENRLEGSVRTHIFKFGKAAIET
jgi:hypothetical protein